jgi:hypothetical protein
MIFGASSLSNSTTSRWVPFGFYPSVPGAGNFYSIDALFDFQVLEIQAQHNFPSGNGNPIVYNLLVNNVSVLSVSVDSDTNVAARQLGPVQISDGDQIDIRADKAASIGGPGTIHPIVTLHCRRP